MKLFKLMTNGQRLKVTSAKSLEDLRKKIRTSREALANCFLYLDELGKDGRKMGFPDWVELQEINGEDHEAVMAQKRFKSYLFD